VIGDGFSFGHRRHERLIDAWSAGPAGGGMFDGHDTQGCMGLGGQQFDLQVPGEAGDVGERGGHLGGLVAGNHG